MRRVRMAVFPVLVVIGVGALVATAARSPVHPVPPSPQPDDLANIRAVDQRVDHFFTQRWQENGIVPAAAADELQILRRLSLALHGTVPSLEEIRRFDADHQPDRLERWTIQLLRDRRFADYFSVRMARSLIGAEVGQFIIFRRDRFTNWLADQIHEDRPYDEIVREMIADEGLWTGEPSTNFITQAAVDGVLDANKLAGRTSRAFLGQRIDCAQCHNHPFAEWKQAQFEGLAACYGQARITGLGIHDNEKLTWKTEDRMTQEPREVSPVVPFGAEWWPAEGTVRERLAGWITHADNRRFERAVVNRVWGLLFARPWHAPVDDIPNPNETADVDRDLLDLLGRDFREHNCDLRRLVFLITASQPFRLSSQHPAYESGERIDDVETHWAAFPLARLRPEQMIGAMVQAASIKTIDQNSHLVTRLFRLIRESDFVKEYGDLGETELEERTGTIPQALLRMNGRFAEEMSNAGPFNATGRIAGLAASDDECLDISFLCCLARRPTAEERAFYLAELQARPNQRGNVVEDLYWALFNSPEFCWNH
jgi:hypothetical protein